jgi:hypothetical protein
LFRGKKGVFCTTSIAFVHNIMEQKSMSENITLYGVLLLSGALCLVAIQNSVIDNPDFTFLDLVYDLLITKIQNENKLTVQ